jgi:hypothetical protein
MANKKPSNNNFLNWILWWQIDQAEIDKQVKGYNTLGVWKSARGNSFLLLSLSSAVTALLIILGVLDVFALVDIALMMIVGFFMLQGKKLAMLIAMVLWTFEKVMTIGSLNSSAVSSLIWWTTYMHVFYTAYKVEEARAK